MKRWLLWFGAGFFLLVVYSVLILSGDKALMSWGVLVALPLVPWTLVTVFAVPIAAVRWLVRGR